MVIEKNQMMNIHYYNVAGLVMAVQAPEVLFARLDNCLPFEVPPSSALLTLRVEVAEEPLPQNWSEEWRQEEDGNEIVCGHAGEHPVFIFCHHGRMIGLLTTSADYRTGRLVMPRYAKLAVDNAMMITFALATACADTLLFHASVVSCHGKAYMFLGPSGTGKSTHSQLWIKHIEGSRLINDDNPVVRLQDDGRVMVYGSPWSGKTPCYLQTNCPLCAIVWLKQAPHNRISRLHLIDAYAALLSSISGKRWDRRVADGLHHSVNRLLSLLPVHQLECLPDAEAAQICYKNGE